MAYLVLGGPAMRLRSYARTMGALCTMGTMGTMFLSIVACQGSQDDRLALVEAIPRCNTAADCPTSSNVCQRPVCNRGLCESEALGASTYLPDEACTRVRCEDGKVVREPFAIGSVASVNAPVCKRAICNADAGYELVPDPAATARLMDDVGGDCQRPVCTSTGDLSYQVDLSDYESGGNCRQDAGVPASAPTSNCTSACTDSSKSATSYASAHDFGSVTTCDSTGGHACGVLNSGESRFFRFQNGGASSFCPNDPDVSISFNGNASACIYYDASAPACPSGWDSKTDGPNGQMGCCARGINLNFRVEPSSFSVATIVLKDPSSCASFGLDVHR